MPTNTSPTRPTREQVLQGLRGCLREQSYQDVELDENTHFWPLMDKLFLNDWVLELDFLWPVDRFFGIPSKLPLWMDLFCYGNPGEPPNKRREELTCGEIADWIIKQLALEVSFEPAVLLSKPCRPAGVFLGIEKLTQKLDPEVAKFGPSSNLRDSLSGLSRDRFFHMLHWMTDGAAPSPGEVMASRSFWTQVSDIAALLIGVASFIAWILVSFPALDFLSSEWAAGLSTGFYFLWIIFVYYGGRWLVERYANPLPPGIITFRDLAMLISDRMQKQAEHTSPNVQVT